MREPVHKQQPVNKLAGFGVAVTLLASLMAVAAPRHAGAATFQVTSTQCTGPGSIT